jgi:Ni/Co efflux regulator RcnB
VLRLIKEIIMTKTIFTIAGSALIALSMVQFAGAAEQPHRGKVHHRVARDSNAAVLRDNNAAAAFRNSNAYAAPAYQAAPQYQYSGDYSAPAGR